MKKEMKRVIMHSIKARVHARMHERTDDFFEFFRRTIATRAF